MPRKGAGSKFRCKPVRETGKEGKFSKSSKKNTPKEEPQVQNDVLDSLLLIHSNLASLVNQIDELVGKALKVDITNQAGRREIQSFTAVLSNTISSLQPWVPKFQRAVSNLSTTEGENQSQEDSACVATPCVSKKVERAIETPEKTQAAPLISPSPFVSWRGQCTIERGKQLFLLTPLPKRQGSKKPLFERPSSNDRAPLLSIPIDSDHNLIQAQNSSSECGFASPNPEFLLKDGSMVVATPCLNISPPKSCVFLEPFFKPANVRNRKSTPFPKGVQNCDSDSDSDSDSDISKALNLKYRGLFGKENEDKSGITGASGDWFISPPKSCVIMEPETGANPSCSHSEKPGDVQNKCYLINSFYKTGGEDGIAVIECTPMSRKSERRGQRLPGEETLKRELWSRFEAASSANEAPKYQPATQNRFLARLYEISSDD